MCSRIQTKMSKRKQVSAEEKRTRMLDLFHEKKDFYQLKVIIYILILIDYSRFLVTQYEPKSFIVYTINIVLCITTGTNIYF